jgi:hypothetical protein
MKWESEIKDNNKYLIIMSEIFTFNENYIDNF